jgi:hypothetical protein
VRRFEDEESGPLGKEERGWTHVHEVDDDTMEAGSSSATPEYEGVMLADLNAFKPAKQYPECTTTQRELDLDRV